MADNVLKSLIANMESKEDPSEEASESAAQEQREKEELLESLARAISSKFLVRAAKRLPKENQWLRAASLYYGKLALDGYYKTSETPFAKGTYTDRPDINIVRAKCAIAIAQTVSMQFGTTNKNWDLTVDKGNDDPAAQVGCEEMEEVIDQQLEECKYSYNCRQAMWDRVVLGTGVLKGPKSEGSLVRAYNKVAGTTVWTPTLTVDFKPVIRRINPWFFYPDETTDQTSELGDVIETHPMSAFKLKQYMKHPGFIPDAIERVLESKPQDFRASNWADFAKLSENNPNLYKDKYLILEYHGPITRTQLDKLEIDPCYESVNDEYYGEVWVCSNEIIRIELEEIEATFSVPYYVSVWDKDPGFVFGYGVPLMMEDAQRVVNQSWHMILDNTAISSGPQVAMQKHLVEPADGRWEFGPRQIWYLTDPQAKVQDAIQFFNVPNVTEQITPILNMAMGFSDQESGIPLITAGLASPENTETATGSLMVHQASTTLLDFMSEEWDDNITAPIIQNMYAWNMQNNPRDDIKGSYKVDVRTSTQFKNKQLHLRDLEKLSVESNQNPSLGKWINQDQLSKARLSMMNLPTDTIVKDDAQVKQDEAAAANAPPPPQVMELQLKAREIALKEAELQFKMKQEVQEAAWTHEEKMADVQVRMSEAQARVASSQNDKDVAIMTLQQQGQQHDAKLQSDQQMATTDNQTKAFLKGLEESRKRAEAESYATQVQTDAMIAHKKLESDTTLAAHKMMLDHHAKHAKIQSDEEMKKAALKAKPKPTSKK